MSFLDKITVLVLTKNEEANIARTLAALSRFSEIVVLDSGSDDATCAIVSRVPNARLASRSFDTHAGQWNHGLTLLKSERPWVLALDADYVLPQELVDEIAALSPDAATSGYRASFRYCVQGKPLRGSLYPPVVVLFRRDQAKYVQLGHTHRLELMGEVRPLLVRVHHDDRKPLSHWIAAQGRYARLEAAHILTTPPERLRRTDRMRRAAWIAPLLVLPYVLFAKRCIFDGWRGWHYALQRLAAEAMIGLAVLELRANPGPQECLSVSRDPGSV